jgi:hypothetical protein
MGSILSPEFMEAARAERYRLEAVLRHVPEFRAHQEILRLLEVSQQSVGPADAAGSMAAAAPPSRRGDIEIGSVADRPARAAASSTNSPSSPSGSSNPPTAPRRGGWKKGDSESARIRDASAKYLKQIGRRAESGEICRAILAMGVTIRGPKPATRVAARLRYASVPIRKFCRFGFGFQRF